MFIDKFRNFFTRQSSRISNGLTLLSHKIKNLKETIGRIAAINSTDQLTEEKLQNFGKKNLHRKLSILVIFLIIYIMLFYCFQPNLIFSSTTTNGGDTGSHNYIAKFYIEELFPNFKMTGWSMGWFAGIPMLTFYFPLSYFLMALLSKIFIYNISFKLVTILGSLMLPVCLYAFGKLFRLKSPYPEIASISAIAFLYMKSFTIYGGNLLGSLAGEFSYSLSFGLVFLFLGTLNRGIEREKFDWLFVINSLLVACIALSHIITLIALLIIVPGFLFVKKGWKTARYIILVLAVGFFLSSFWLLPFVFNIMWTPPMRWTNLNSIRNIFPLEIIPAMTLGAFGLFFAIIKKDKRMFIVIWSIIAFIAIFFSYNGDRFYNARLLPFIFMFIYLLAAYGLNYAYWAIISALNKINVKEKVYRFAIFGLIPLVVFLTSASIIAGNPLAPKWARDNYTGFESKADWKLYDSLMDYLSALPEGRVMFEFNKELLSKFGTPRSFELIPFWTDQPVMEGLLVESSLTAPFHYINQAELSVKPRGTVAGWSLPARNYKKAMTHLKYMNIRYIIASSPEVIEDLKSDNTVRFLKEIEPFSFFEIKGKHDFVEIADNIPVKYKTDNWVWDMRNWYFNIDNIDSPVLFDNGKEDMKNFQEIDKSELINVPKNPIENEGTIIYEKVENEKITFKTTGIGQPHIIKVSYFPNWKAIGAEGPYLVSPSFMMVIPTQEEVTIVYGKTLSNILGIALTNTGLAILLGVLVLNFIKCLKAKKSK